MPERTLLTERLELRPHRPDDLADSLAMWSDPSTTRFITGTPSTEQQAWMRILGYAGQWSLLGFGTWVVLDRATGGFAGEAGFANFKRDIAPAMRDVPELSWAIAPAFRGRGYATEAARAALAWADGTLGVPRTVCLVDAANGASLRVAEKAGFTAFERAPFNGKPAVFFERIAAG